MYMDDELAKQAVANKIADELNAMPNTELNKLKKDIVTAACEISADHGLFAYRELFKDGMRWVELRKALYYERTEPKEQNTGRKVVMK